VFVFEWQQALASDNGPSWSDEDSRMSMFLDIFAALLAWGLAAAWVLTGRKKLPPEWDHLRTGSADKIV
jgi:hypothetical protein